MFGGRRQLGDGAVFGVGLRLTAYLLGMRHAFDADHIAAIDNTTRKLMADGQRPVTVWFWFALGHSSIGFGLCALLALGVRALAGQVEDDSSTLQQITGLIGTTVSGTFLMLIAILNAVVLAGIVEIFRRMRTGTYDEAELERQLDQRGLLNRVLRPVMRAVTKPWHMYPVGVLFGLGFDTATEVSLLVLAGGAAAFALPWYAILTLPLLFAAGMSLLDSFDGAFMTKAHSWAIELISILTDKLGITSGPLAWIGQLDLNYVGYIVVGLFVLTWIAAVFVWRAARLESRWVVALQPAEEPQPLHGEHRPQPY